MTQRTKDTLHSLAVYGITLLAIVVGSAVMLALLFGML